MSQQAQIDALEHLVLAILKTNALTLSLNQVVERAEASIMSEEGPPGTTEKTQAREYLSHLLQQFRPRK
jgi:hypothetical protein